jgi:thiamine biosynthesis lipoprotein
MLIARARPLLGTMVTIQAHTGLANAHEVTQAIARTFERMAHIACVMSAHHHTSDLGRMAHASAGAVLVLDRDTVCVLQAAQHWTRLSRGAFNPCVAAQTLSRQHQRPGVAGSAHGRLHHIHIHSATEVTLTQAVQLDLGGIAKGYAVDCAIEVLRAHGVTDALVNAGGDLRAMGCRHWPIDVRHAKTHLMGGQLMHAPRLHQKALATSVAGPLNPEFVRTRPRRKLTWQSASIQANTCIAADALTKWALQSSLLCPDLRAALRENGGRMWRSQ